MLHEVSEIITHEWQRPSLDIMQGFSGAATAASFLRVVFFGGGFTSFFTSFS